MKLGIGSFSYPWHIVYQKMDVFDLLDKAAEHRIEVVQVCDNLPLINLSTEENRGVAARAKALGIQVEVGTRGLSAKNVMRHLDLCKIYRSPILRIVIDTKEYEPSLPEIIAILRPLLAELEAANVVLAIENHDRFRARDLRQIIDTLASDRVGICLDGANSLGAGEDIYTVLDQLAPLVVNLHLKDFSIRRLPTQLGFIVEGQASGDGMLDLQSMLPRLPQNITAIVELWVPERESLDATLSLENAWVERSISNMKAIL
jgi:sugar phosphate isomerase/epimerase